MQELEKILKEIDKISVDDIGVGVDCNLQGRSDLPCDNCYECIKDACKDIIRKHMNDGWILCEERLPEEPKKGGDIKQYNVTIEGAEESTSLFYIGHGTWRDEDCNWYKVVAWCPLPKPYCPEKGEGE